MRLKVDFIFKNGGFQSFKWQVPTVEILGLQPLKLVDLKVIGATFSNHWNPYFCKSEA